MIKLELVKPVRKLGMLVPGSCCDEAGDGEAREEAGDDENDEATDGEARDVVSLQERYLDGGHDSSSLQQTLRINTVLRVSKLLSVSCFARRAALARYMKGREC